jgi:hypothetical protein
LAGVADLGDRVDMKALVAALKVNDIDGAIAAMHITEGAFYQYTATKTAAYAQGGGLGRNHDQRATGRRGGISIRHGKPARAGMDCRQCRGLCDAADG